MLPQRNKNHNGRSKLYPSNLTEKYTPMARYKHIDTNPRFLPVDLARQLLPGTFEHALNHLLDHEIDLSDFDKRFVNDLTGAAAYPPAMLFKGGALRLCPRHRQQSWHRAGLPRTRDLHCLVWR